MAIHFYSEEIPFPDIQKPVIKRWLLSIAQEEQFAILSLNIIFCTDKYLSTLNQEYLNHDTLTDIITFRYHSGPGPIEGEIFISIERVRENSGKYQASFENELHRVIVHGFLHLCGFRDKTHEEKSLMRDKENFYLSKL